ncbi:RAB39B [Cordylochernes scorpioides]|uniref:RAB39B n=1 Tax=Cordylochernes scorpioides TaxID=51811 RepID=A0ABY6L608_9ARAC|nr:RAB39B [Cordylochernes scorpioides]
MIEPLFDYTFRLILIGDTAVGKSTLLRSFTEAKFIDGDPTVGVDFFSKILRVKNGIKIKLQLWDTAGQERFSWVRRVLIWCWMPRGAAAEVSFCCPAVGLVDLAFSSASCSSSNVKSVAGFKSWGTYLELEVMHLSVGLHQLVALNKWSSFCVNFEYHISVVVGLLQQVFGMTYLPNLHSGFEQVGLYGLHVDGELGELDLLPLYHLQLMLDPLDCEASSKLNCSSAAVNWSLTSFSWVFRVWFLLENSSTVLRRATVCCRASSFCLTHGG